MTLVLKLRLKLSYIRAIAYMEEKCRYMFKKHAMGDELPEKMEQKNIYTRD